MITEDYCSFELSKLLKEKGFDESCNSFYILLDNGDYRYTMSDFPYKNSRKYNVSSFARPTHQMAMKWLREKHKIYAYPMQQGNYDDNSMYYSYSVAQIIDGRSYIQRPMSVTDKFTYEEAVEAALKYVLENLI